MTNTQSKVPQLRFPEFSGSWTLTRAYKYCDLISGQHLSPNDYNTVCEGKPYFTGPSDFTESQRNVTKWTNLDCKKSKLGEILITVKGSGVGAMAINNLGTLAIGRQLMSIAPINGMNAEYIYQYFLTKRQYLQSLAMGNMIPGLSRPDILNVKFPLGSTSESEKIASFLSSVDKKSNLLKQKREQLVQYKKGIMQQLFSQQLRFKDDDGQDFPDWEVKPLSEYIVKHEEKTTVSDQYPVLTSSRKGLYFQTDYYKGQVASENNAGYNVVPRGYFTYRHMSDDLIFKFNINDLCDRGIVSTLYPVFTTKSVNDQFLQMKLNEGDEFKRFAIMQKQGGSRTYMYLNKLINLKVKMPLLEEQNKIMLFISSIDQKINLAQQQVEQTQSYKQGLLQQMFV